MARWQETMNPPPIDLLSPAFYLDARDAYAWMRRRSPVHFDEKNRLWGVTRMEDLRSVERRADVFVNSRGYRSLHTPAEVSMLALDDPALITVQMRNLANLTDPDRRRVRALQRRYVEVWVETIRRTVPDFDEPTARAAAHAVFGLINSTPHSAHLDRDQMAALLSRMALASLTPAVVTS